MVAADRVFESRDPAEVTFEDIAAEAGVSRALVYNYFGDKGGLLAAVYTRALATLDANLSEALVADVEPRERIRRVVEIYLAFAGSNAGAWHFLGHVAAAHHPAVQSARHARLEMLAKAWGGTPAARVAVAGLVGLLETAVMHWLDAPELGRDQMADLLESFVWSGISGLPVAGVREPEPVTP